MEPENSEPTKGECINVIKRAATLALANPMASPLQVPSPQRFALKTLTSLLWMAVIAGVVLLMPRNAPADLESAVQTYNNGQHEAAIAELTGLAKAGNTHAAYALGVIYGDGKGAVADPKKALKWLLEAANQGNSNAQYSLGIMHAKGSGTPRDLVRGLMWVKIAAKDTQKDPFQRMRIISILAAIKKSMTPEQISEAEKLAAKWQPGQQ